MLTLVEARRLSGLEVEAFVAQLTASAATAGGLAVRLRDPAWVRRELEVARPVRCVGHDLMRRLSPAPGQQILTVGIQKGGVGKTVISINLAVALAMAGRKVLFIDCDPQASATNFLLPEEVAYEHLPTMLEVCCEEEMDCARAAIATRYPGLDLLAAKPLIRKVDAVLRSTPAVPLLRRKIDSAAYDCVVFDVPPGFGELVRAAYLLSDRVVMPVLPDAWSIESAALTRADIADAAAEAGTPEPVVSLLLNRFRPGRIASTDALAVVEEDNPGMILPQTLPETAVIQNAVNNGTTVLEGSAPVLREVFLELVTQMAGSLPSPTDAALIP